MKLISTLYSTPNLDFTLTIQSRNSRTNNDEVPPEPLIVKYRSKLGNESLIFNPSVAIVIRNKAIHEVAKTAYITQQLFYRFVTSLTAVYQGLGHKELFTENGGVLYMDKKKANELSMRMSLFRNVMTLAPCVIPFKDNTYMKGIDFIIDNSSIGTVTHLDALGILELLEHFDLATFSLLAGVVDELDMMNSKLDMMNVKLDTLLKLIQEQSSDKTFGPPKEESIVLPWEPVHRDLY